MTDELIQDTVGIVYEQQCEELEDLEGNIVTLIQSNYERRQALIQAMDRVNSLWGNQYKKLRRSILNEAASDEEEEVPGKGEVRWQPRCRLDKCSTSSLSFYYTSFLYSKVTAFPKQMVNQTGSRS